MKFDVPAGVNPIDRATVIGRPIDRAEGKAKVTGTAHYAYERHDVAPGALYGWIVGSTIAKGRIARIDCAHARSCPGVIAVVTADNAGRIGKVTAIVADMLVQTTVQHYDQAVALVVAETLEQARAAAAMVRVDYIREPGRFDMRAARNDAVPALGGKYDVDSGDFTGAFARCPVSIDQIYTMPHQSQAMMEPYATTAAWSGDKLTLWTSTQILSWAIRDIAEALMMAPNRIRIESPYVGGGFGGKLWICSDAVLAALGARATGRPVKVAVSRPQIFNNTTHRSAAIQRIRIGADVDGRIIAFGHEVWSANLAGGDMKGPAAQSADLLYRTEHRLNANRLIVLDLPEAGAMRAPGAAPGMLAVEVAMDEMAEKLVMDPVRLRIINDVQHDPTDAKRPFSTRKLVECLETGADKFGWSARIARPGRVRDGEWLVGLGMASAIRHNLAVPSGARVGVDHNGIVTVETDMTDIGTGSYTVIAQTAAEMMGVAVEQVVVKLGDSNLPVSAGSVGQWGANSATAGVYAACVKLRALLARKAGFNEMDVSFDRGRITSEGRSVRLSTAAGADGVVAEEMMTYGDLAKTYAQASFGAFFCEVGVNQATSEVRVRRMLGVFAAGRILNPKTARSQLIGGMTMGIGSALMEDLVVDTRFGFFVNHDLAEYHVPAHADVPHQEVIFIDELDDKSSPMKAKGVGELGICGSAAAVANAVYNACGVRLRDYPLTLDKIQTARDLA